MEIKIRNHIKKKTDKIP